MRVRVRYAKQRRLRFISAIDLGRVWERALRRANLPIAYSEGFSPHPRVSFPDALPLGYASTGEYAELVFAGPVAVDPAMAALNAAFPDGLAVLTAAAVPDGAPRLARALRASVWDLRFEAVDPGRLAEAAAAARRADVLPVDRTRKDETVRLDLRPAIATIATQDLTLRVTLHHPDTVDGVTTSVRPTEVHLALRTTAAPDLPEPSLVTRVAQGRPGDEGLHEALTGEFVPASPPAPTLDLKQKVTTRERLPHRPT